MAGPYSGNLIPARRRGRHEVRVGVLADPRAVNRPGEVKVPREARLRPEFAHLYPYLTPGVWELASVLVDRVVAAVLGRPDGKFISRERALDPEHFEFRGHGARRYPPGQRREDAG